MNRRTDTHKSGRLVRPELQSDGCRKTKKLQMQPLLFIILFIFLKDDEKFTLVSFSIGFHGFFFFKKNLEEQPRH